MAVALIPLVGRAVSIILYNVLSGPNASPEATIVAQKLLLPARLCYALFQWCLKLCLADFYFRLTDRSTYMPQTSQFLWWFIVSTFAAVLVTTLLECRPLSKAWEYDPKHTIVCQRGLINLLVMASLNVITDIALILLPIPVLWKLRLLMKQKLQLCLIFGVGIFVITVTFIRIPITLYHGDDQKTRSMWASVEIVTACLVANVAFFYALLKDWRDGHSNSKGYISSYTARGSITSYHLGSAKSDFSKGIRRTDEVEVEYSQRRCR
ncbi:hypothetical protein EG328_005728 [Venturia inaequalis]|uniref:Rhodopsin domain-containing protein n=1 Tax=Venturia inaequalis TaxID=5025 RepID=A0A8H3UKG6_VENIN|nr:hypothetical protein EG328_005728 [Venturia inaequalis]